MYTLEQLQKKSLKELKEIGWELNVLPEGDRRLRQTWRNAIAGVSLPLLQLLAVSAASVEQVQEPIIETVETAPGVEVEPVQDAPLESKFGRIVYPRPAQGAISQVAKTSPGVEVARVAEPISQVAKTSPGVEGDRVQDIINQTWTSWEKEYCAWLKGAEWCVHKGENKQILAFLPVSKTLRLEGMEPGTEYCAIWDVSECSFDFAGRPLPVCSSLYAHEPIAPVAETSPGVEVEQAQKRIEEGFNIEDLWKLDEPNCPACGGIHSLDARWSQEYAHGFWIIYCDECDFTDSCSIELLPPCLRDDDEGEDEDEDEDDNTDSENSSGVEVDHLPECVECFGDGYLEDESGLIKSCSCSSSEPKLSCQKTQSAITPAVKNLPGSRSKTSTAHQLLELFKSSAHIIEDSPGVKTEETVSESAIAPAVKTSLAPESDRNPMLTGITFSDRFVALYSAPQAEVFHFQLDADGQLSLLDFEVQSEPEPPDPDDFESLDEFREAIALWDAEHPSTFDHFSDHLPSSVHCESSSVHCESSSVHSEPLEVSLDSFCEWAPCPAEWYESRTFDSSIKGLEVSELSIGKSSSTSDFFIPTFAEGDRPDRGDEPPDTGIFARLPKPKPPTFPPQASQHKSTQVSLSQSGIPKLSRNYLETIPKPFHRVVAGSSTQPARSPPGGDASSA